MSKHLRESTLISDRSLFILVCMYWLSQSFLIPLAPIGPSWALWPTISDIIAFTLIPFVLYRSSSNQYDLSTSTVLNLAWLALVLCTGSFLLASSLYGWQKSDASYGMYQIYRMLEFLVVLLATAKMRLSPFRKLIFSRVALIAFCLIVFGIFLTFSGLVTTGYVSPLIPLSRAISGPWGGYAAGGEAVRSCGFIGYNHGYVAIQLILIGGVAYICYEHSRRIRLLICSLLLISTFISESRMGLIAALLLILALEWKQKKSNLLALAILCGICGLWAVRSVATANIAERQESSATSLEEDGASGRTGIWQEHIDYFILDPLNLPFGTGYGYNLKASSSNAHMLYLHVMTETGLIGLAMFLFMQVQTLRLLKDPPLRTMRLVVYALLFTGLTQETLYPVTAVSQFLGLYLSALVLTIRLYKPDSVRIYNFLKGPELCL